MEGILLRRRLLNKKKKKIQLIAQNDPQSPITEQFRLLRNNIHFSAVDMENKTIVVTSPEPSDGKSTTAANLAIVLAQDGKKVILVDADLRKPSIHYTFNLSHTEGLTSVLSRKVSISAAINRTAIPGLHILTSGPVPPNPAKLVHSYAMGFVIEKLKEVFDYVIIDTPPILSVTDAQIIANKCDGVILVISGGKTYRERAKKAKEILENARAQILGVVVNRVKPKKNEYYGNYS